MNCCAGADDGAQALEAVRVGAFDLALIDVHMPGMDGLSAIGRALSRPQGAEARSA